MVASVPPARTIAQAERRQVTVMFCDLVGSTAISSRLDPEELRELVYGYRAKCAAIVEQFLGYVAQYLGDGILAYFGYPTAHEDDVERAVRAALRIVQELPQIDTGSAGVPKIPLAARLGIATGLVVAPSHRQFGEDSVVIGQTPNVAARLQELAPPNGIVVAPETRRLLGERFTFEDLGTRELPGMPVPLRPWRVVGPNDALSRFQAAHGHSLTPLVGREEQLDLLWRRWTQAQAGTGHFVLLFGEAGIGKSRIAETLLQRLPADAAYVVRLQCSSHHTNSALYPLISWLERTLELHPDDAAEQRLAKIDRLVAGAGQPVEPAVPLLAALLATPTGSRYTALDVTSRMQRDRTLSLLQQLMIGLAAPRPLLVIVEDAHWIDPTSQVLFDLFQERVTALPALVVITTRPGYWPAWTGSAGATLVVLSRLSHDRSAEMVRRIVGWAALPEELQQQIVAKTDGVPLFIEEVTKAVLEPGFQAEGPDGDTRSRTSLPRLIPASLQDSLMARLDQTALGKDIAQIGGVLGRQFSLRDIGALSSLPEAELQLALDQLVRTDLLSCHGTPPESTYVFKHALVQEAAYESLLHTRRQDLHRRVVQLFEATQPEMATRSPEVLAYHCEAGRLLEKAVHYWHAAGRWASERSANLEAIADLRRGLDVLAGLPDAPERDQLALTLLVTLGPALINAKGPKTREVADCYAQALDRCARLPESQLHFAALWGAWRIAEDFPTKRDRAVALLGVAERLGDPGLRLQAHHCSWASLFHLAQHQACCTHVDHGLDLYDGTQHRTHGALYGGHDPRVCGLGEKAFALWLLGFPEQSLQASDEAGKWARELGHGASIVHALNMRLLLHRYRRDSDAAACEAEELIALADQQQLPVHRAIGRMFRGWAQAERGAVAEGIEQMREGLELQKAIGTREDFPVLFDMLAGVYAMAGHPQLALDLVDEILAETRRTGLVYWTAELHRTRGEVLLAQSPDHETEAEGWLRQAAALAQAQHARSLELRAVTSLARLEQRRGHAEVAYQLLAPIHASLSEGRSTADLVEARALIDQLEGARGRP